MPRYFFDLQEERSLVDQDGMDLVDITAAKIVAVAAAACLLRNDPKCFWCDRDWHLRVRGEHDRPLFEIAFSMRDIESPNERSRAGCGCVCDESIETTSARRLVTFGELA